MKGYKALIQRRPIERASSDSSKRSKGKAWRFVVGHQLLFGGEEKVGEVENSENSLTKNADSRPKRTKTGKGFFPEINRACDEFSWGYVPGVWSRVLLDIRFFFEMLLGRA